MRAFQLKTSKNANKPKNVAGSEKQWEGWKANPGIDSFPVTFVTCETPDVFVMHARRGVCDRPGRAG